MEKALLHAALSSRTSYALIQEHVKPGARNKKDSRYSEEFRILLDRVGAYYENDKEADGVDIPVFNEMIGASIPAEKHRERFRNIVNEAISAETSVPNINTLILMAKRHEVGTKLAQKLINRDAVEEELAEYNKLMAEEQTADSGDEVGLTGTSALEQLLSVDRGEAGMKIRPASLMDAIGNKGLKPGNKITMFARPECFSEDTELLTPSGWKPLPGITCEDTVAAVNLDREVVWENPAATVVSGGHDRLLHIYNNKGQVDLVVTPGHGMVFEKRNGLEIKPAEELLYYQGIKTHTAAHASGTREWTAKDALYVAWQADGRSAVYKAHGYSGDRYVYTIEVDKAHKRERLLYLAKESGLDHTYSTDNKRGYLSLSFKTHDVLDKEFSYLDVEELSMDFCCRFAEELSYWDGSVRSGNRWKYSNTKEAAVDKAQAIVCMSGYNTFKSAVPDKRGYSTCYELHIRKNYTPVDGQSVVKAEIEACPDTLMYCITTSTGMLLVRRNGKVSVQGNCGKSGFAVTNAAGWAMDGHKVLYLINEDPAESMFMRAVSCLTGMAEHEVLSNPGRAMELAKRRGLDNLTLMDIHPGSVAEIDALVKKLKPDVVIVDQLRNLKSKADSRVNQLDEVARELRDVAKANGIVLMDITQAGESAEGKAILSPTDIDSSKTGVVGANDLLIGIGATKEQESMGYRILTLCRNKINGNHASVTVKIDPTISRYSDV